MLIILGTRSHPVYPLEQGESQAPIFAKLTLHVTTLCQDIIAIVEEILRENLPNAEVEQDWVDLSESDEAADREMQAYIDLHPLLKQKYFGKHVAIYGGKLIDYDDNFEALYDRIDRAYPDEFVWMSKVGEEPIETLTVRSPRFSQQEPQ